MRDEKREERAQSPGSTLLCMECERPECPWGRPELAANAALSGTTLRKKSFLARRRTRARAEPALTAQRF